MGQVSGKVVKVTTAKGQVKTDHGVFDKLNVTVESETGENVVIQKLAKPGNDGQGFIGKRVQVTYKSKSVENSDGDTIELHSTDSKGFVLVDQPAFSPKGASHSTTTGSSTTASKGTYNSDGARHGMIVNNAVELAGLRGKHTLKDLLQAADDIKALTEHVESGKTAPTTTVSKTETVKKTKVVEEDDEENDPF